MPRASGNRIKNALADEVWARQTNRHGRGLLLHLHVMSVCVRTCVCVWGALRSNAGNKTLQLPVCKCMHINMHIYDVCLVNIYFGYQYQKHTHATQTHSHTHTETELNDFQLLPNRLHFCSPLPVKSSLLLIGNCLQLLLLLLRGQRRHGIHPLLPLPASSTMNQTRENAGTCRRWKIEIRLA